MHDSGASRGEAANVRLDVSDPLARNDGATNLW
jgi:hypothetical protein